MGVSLTIAFGFMLAGAWVILSFSLLEIAILGALYTPLRQVMFKTGSNYCD